MFLQPTTVATYPHEFEKKSLRPDLPFDFLIGKYECDEIFVASFQTLHSLFGTNTMHIYISKNYRVYWISHLDRLDLVMSHLGNFTHSWDTHKTSCGPWYEMGNSSQWNGPATSPLLGSYPFDHWRFAIHIDVRLSIVPWRWLLAFAVFSREKWRFVKGKCPFFKSWRKIPGRRFNPENLTPNETGKHVFQKTSHDFWELFGIWGGKFVPSRLKVKLINLKLGWCRNWNLRKTLIFPFFKEDITVSSNDPCLKQVPCLFSKTLV